MSPTHQDRPEKSVLSANRISRIGKKLENLRVEHSGHHLALRLERRRASGLHFLFDLNVPFTNNQCGQNLRMMKLRMTISRGFRSLQGAQNFATLRSVLSTARRQGLKPIETLLQGPTALLERVGVDPSLRSSGQ